MPDIGSVGDVSTAEIDVALEGDIELRGKLKIADQSDFFWHQNVNKTTTANPEAESCTYWDPDTETSVDYKVPVGREALVLVEVTRAGGGQFASTTFKVQGSTTLDTDNGRQLDSRTISTSSFAFFGVYLLKASEFLTIVNLNTNNITIGRFYAIERDATT